MEEITFNEDNIKTAEIDEVVVRTKALIINNQNEILLGLSNNTFQFPGGHLEENETLEDCIIREVKEETGMDISNYSLTPFLKISYFHKNYNHTHKNRRNDLYYFLINCDLKYDLNQTSYDELEIANHYKIKIISLDEIDDILKSYLDKNPINKYVTKEMLMALNEYRQLIKVGS